MLRRFLAGLCLTMGIVSYGVIAQARIIDVCPLVCTYAKIQDGINEAQNGDTVLVKDGIYNENIDFKGKSITVISENGPTRTIIKGTARGYVVTFQKSEGTKSVLSGFTIQNGGSGIYCKSSSPQITNCIISGNRGGGIYCFDSSSPIITNCTISGNMGGGMYCYNKSSPQISTCTISGNKGALGGIYCINSSPTITNCIIRGNLAEHGGGIYCNNYSSPTITNCTISGNNANKDGGGIICGYSLPTITNCTIGSNSGVYGGGIYYGNRSSSTNTTNCTIVGNLASRDGGGIYCDVSSPKITNCTISDNSAKKNGGWIYCKSSSPTVVNSILWGEGYSSQQIYLEGSTINITYSDIKGSWGGTGNINRDPLFVGGGNYHLKAGSPCIDKGTSIGAPPNDIDGDKRPQGAGYDMGSDEYVSR